MIYISYSFVLPLILAITAVSKSPLIPRKSELTDRYITCYGSAPTHAEGLPAAYSEAVYNQSLDLCSAVHGAHQNVGCFCPSASAGLDLDFSLADPVLVDAIYDPVNFDPSDYASDVEEFEVYGRGPPTLVDFCFNACYCDFTGSESEDSLSDSDDDETNDSVRAPPNRFGQPPNDAGGSLPFAQNTFAKGSIESSSTFTAQHHAWHYRCGHNCTTDNDCRDPARKESKCTCATHSSQYQPGPGTVAYVAACLIAMGTGGKRDVEWPCPCNSTYVSHGCCGASDGLVWEAAESKLGELVAGH